MASWLIFIVFCLLSGTFTTLLFWMGDIAFTNKQFKDACERVTERDLEKMKMLIDNTKIEEVRRKIEALEVKMVGSSAETAQPVSEPSPADLVLNTVKEDKW